MNQNPGEIPVPRVALVRAAWHADIVGASATAFADELSSLSDGAVQIDMCEVPGAFEIPLQARSMARSGNYAAVVGAAMVADGGIYRHEFVAQTVVGALMQVQLETDVPVLSAVLTPHHFHESAEHRIFFLTHFEIKGREVARACWSVLGLRGASAAAA